MNNQDYKKQLIQKTITFSKTIIKLVDKFPNKRSAWVIADQLIRSATSIGANIVEAQAASSKKDFINFLNHALKSAHETQYWLILTEELGEFTKLSSIKAECDELVKILTSSIKKLRSNK